ncbi:MAG: alanine racemase [Asticcacaulis sp.]
MPSAPARIRLDLAALRHNLAVLREQVTPAKVGAVVKADAYGLGVGTIVPALWAEGVRSFFVARLFEGIKLRALLSDLDPDEAHGPCEIFVLDGCSDTDGAPLVKARLTPVLSSPEQIRAFLPHARAAGLPLSLHIDTGMNRLGLDYKHAEAIPALLEGQPVAWVMSHLACASEREHPLNALQQARFEALKPLFPEAQFSLANSGGCFLGADYHQDLVRPGIALYGGGPFEVPHPDLKPVVHLEARVLQVREIPPQDTVGYGATFRANQPHRAATLGIGYADGLFRSLGAHGLAARGTDRFAFMGRISMDLCNLDVTDAHPPVMAGNWIELIGANRPLDTVAHDCGTLAYELLTRLSPRLPRLIEEA